MTSQTNRNALSPQAYNLHFSSIVIDTHADTPQRFIDGDFDLAPRTAKGSVDIPRMKEGGLDAVFFSIWLPSKVRGPIAVQRALQQIQAVHDQVAKHSTDLVFATTAGQIREARRQNKIAILLGVEGGHMIDNDLSTLPKYADQGVRYMTLTHSGTMFVRPSSPTNPSRRPEPSPESSHR